MDNWVKCQPRCQKCEQNVFLRVVLIKQSYCIGLKNDISMVVLSPGSAEINVGWGGKLNSHLMASCVRNIRTQNYQHLIIGFQVTVKNVGDVFLRHSVVLPLVQAVVLSITHVLWLNSHSWYLLLDRQWQVPIGYQ